MLSPLPRHSVWGHCFAHSPRPVSLPRKGDRVGLCNGIFEDCSAFTRVTACTLAKSPKVTLYTRGSSHFVTSMTAPIASGWSENCRVGLSPTEKRRLNTAHTLNCRSRYSWGCLECTGSSHSHAGLWSETFEPLLPFIKNARTATMYGFQTFIYRTRVGDPTTVIRHSICLFYTNYCSIAMCFPILQLIELLI
jgi:hypothetical protein